MKCKHCDCKNGRTITHYKFYDVFECSECKRWTRQKIDTCCKKPYEVYVFEYGDFCAEKIYVQCLNCYGCLNRAKPLSFKNYAEKVRGNSQFLKEEFMSWLSAKKVESDEIYEIEKYLNYTTSNRYFYEEHLKSEYWKKTRLLVLKRDKNICQFCKTETATDVHHLTYKNLGHELLDELISYCRSCHEKVHEKTIK